MADIIGIPDQELDQAVARIRRDAEAAGYRLNPDPEFTRELVRGLLINEKRYGYRSCPCRLSSGKRGDDLDLVCPCDYRDPDLDEFDACYCALYVSQSIAEGTKELKPVPERRDPDKMNRQEKQNPGPETTLGQLKYPVWRCKVCGYLCARDNPPALCPICKADKERFERFI